MKTLFTILLLAALPLASVSQNIKYKKEVKPLIDNKTYTIESKNLALQYHSQNTNLDGTLTDKAILIAYDNVYNTRVFLGLCYYSIGVTNEDPLPLDSSLYYLNLAQDMAGVNDVSTLISGVNKKQRELRILQKNKAQKAEEIARKEKYALKTAEVSYKSGEFMGYCRVVFLDAQDNEIVLYNPDLGKYENRSTNCGIMDELINEKFIITHQIEMIEVYSEDAGSSKFESPVLQSITLSNKEKELQINQALLQTYKSEMTLLVEEALKIGVIKADKKLEYNTFLDTITVITEQAEYTKINLVAKIKTQKEKNQSQEKYEAQLTEQANAFGIEQKKIKSSISCSSCPKKVLHSFLIGLQNSDMPSAKKQMSMCCYSSSAKECDSYSQYCRVLSFSKLADNPKSGISRANKWLEAKDKWFVYFESSKVAKIIITPPNGEYYPMSYFMLILENGQWKVFGSDDNERRYYISKYAQKE